jgi:hypothetical protein
MSELLNGYVTRCGKPLVCFPTRSRSFSSVPVKKYDYCIDIAQLLEEA